MGCDHDDLWWKLTGPNEEGLCYCGCGERTTVSKGGVVRRFIRGHHVRYYHEHPNVSAVTSVERSCDQCSGMFLPERLEQRFCSRVCFGSAHSGDRNPIWRGDAVSANAGRTRARVLHPNIGSCEQCGSNRTERHHRDGNTANNTTANIAILCRRCHMKEDGRLDVFIVAPDRTGTRNGRARLTANDVRSIRSRRAAGELGRQLAAEFGVSLSAIYMATQGKSWNQV